MGPPSSRPLASPFSRKLAGLPLGIWALDLNVYREYWKAGTDGLAHFRALDVLRPRTATRVCAEGHWDGVMVSGRVYFFRSNQLGILLGAGGWFCLVLHLCCEWGRARQPLLLTTVQTSSQLQVTLVS